MSIVRRAAGERGQANFGWLESSHSFSFGQYYDPAHMGYRALRVINEDRVRPGEGFPTHGHRDMEIVTYVVEGALAHKDTLGSEGALHRGDVQAMSAGGGIQHSEFNGSSSEDVHFLQIWLLPQKAGLPSAYRQAHFAEAEKRNRLRPIVTPDGAEGSLGINQDVRLYASLLDQGIAISCPLAAGRGAWIQVISGTLEVSGTLLAPGDGAAIENTPTLEMRARSDCEFLLFDLA